jgi:hypothetical protein
MKGEFVPITDGHGKLVQFSIDVEGMFGDSLTGNHKAFAAVNPSNLNLYLLLAENKTIEIRPMDLENISRIDMSQGTSGLLFLLKEKVGKVKVYGLTSSALLAYGHMTMPYVPN